MPVKVTQVAVLVLRISPRTKWTFIEAHADDGTVGVGEATLAGREEAIATEVGKMARAVIGSPVDAQAHGRLPAAMALPQAAARAGLDQALWDLRGKCEAKPVAAMLGAVQRNRVPLYANINRRTNDRTPEGFASSARAALDDGFQQVKIAPFDEVPAQASSKDRGAAARRGLERVEAVRAALGLEAQLLVDCHWRFDEPSSHQLIADIAPYAPHWLECPIPDTVDNIPALTRLRSAANHLGIRLAGNELGIGAHGFLPYLTGGAYDVMMPDVKYVGSLAEMVQMAEQFDRHGVELSPHNPNGPICHAASLHICAVLPKLRRLEIQLGESDLFDEIVGNALPSRMGGTSTLPTGSGFGVELTKPVNRELLDACWSFTDGGSTSRTAILI